ncbi:MAG: FkbM family methyltransferase [Methylocella sp.]
MSVINDFKKIYHEWRRQSLPPSSADSHSRHEVIVRRLDQIEQAITNRFPDTVSWPAQQGEILAVLRLLEPKKVIDYEKIRVGSAGDGGYVQIDHLEGISRAFSFGVSDNDSWDLAMAKAGIPVEQFDHAIEKAPSDHPLLRFHRKMLSADATAQTVTLGDLAAQYSKVGAPDLIVKIDIEGCEWEVFDRATDAVLSRLAQVVCEFHDLSHLTAPAFRARARRVFEKLDKHFGPVNVHGNNCGRLSNVSKIPLPDVLEVTFASRGRYSLTETNEVFPTSLDTPNYPDSADIALGAFRF